MICRRSFEIAGTTQLQRMKRMQHATTQEYLVFLESFDAKANDEIENRAAVVPCILATTSTSWYTASLASTIGVSSHAAPG
eukprot:scaffold8264_cov111-Skeletonema_dohrnii-CCMP3373.AAC.3